MLSRDPVKKRVLYGVLLVIALIFFFEYLIMLLLAKDTLQEKGFIFLFADPILLVAVMAPFFYWLILRPLFKNAEELERAKSAERRFLSSMSHEIRTPLNAIVGLLSFLSETTLDKEQKHYVESIHSASENLMSLIADVLDFTKIEQGHLELESNFFEVRSLEKEIRNVFTPIITSKQIDFVVKNNLVNDVQVLGDIFRLKQVIYNLISNSLKFTQEGVITFQISSKKKGEQQLDLILTLTDTGKGMSAEITEKLFTEFFQGETTIAKKYGGTGLGLSISKRLVDLMGGRIQVASQEGVGSKFTITLPMVFAQHFTENLTVGQIQDEIQIKALSEKEILKKKRQRGQFKILVAEDNQLNLEITMKMLERAGYQSNSVMNGRHVLDEVDQRKYDLILLDCQMPELDGFQVTKELRRLLFKNPIIALTANATKSDKDRSLAAGMNEFISKPVSFEKLTQIIDKSLGI